MRKASAESLLAALARLYATLRASAATRPRSRLLVEIALLAVVATLAGTGAAFAQQQAEPTEAEATGAETDADVDALIRILEDDAARARLLERLREAGAEDVVETRALPQDTLAGRLAEYTQEVAESTARVFGGLARTIERITDVTNDAFTFDLDAVRDAVLDIALLVAATFGAYLILQIGFRLAQRRLAGTAASGDFLTRGKMIGASALLDLASVVAACAVGYVIALKIGRSARIDLDQSLFLNAFLIIESIKVASRTVLSSRWSVLRPVPLDDTSAAYWYFWLSRLLSLVGYTLLFVAPILAQYVSADTAEAARIIVMLTALVISIAIVLQNRESVRARLKQRAAAGRTDALSRLLATVARVWHIAAIVYLVALFALWLADPKNALPFVLTATWKSIVAVLIGVLLSTFIGRMASGGMRLPDDVKARLPLLEARLNAFVPGVLRVVRMVVGVAVAVTLLQVWNIADVAGWLSTETGQRAIAALISASLILLAGGVVYLVVQSWIEYRLNPNLGRLITPRERTLLGLFRNAFSVVLGLLVFMLVLSELGVNIAPLLAGAGVAGLAIGFGAQKLVQDVINGAFIQFENTLNEGDVVQLGGVMGVVERLTIRSVSLRSVDGTYHMIPFSSVDSVSNFTKNFGYHLAAIAVPYRENVSEVKEAMLEAFERLKSTPHRENILSEFDMQGVVEFQASSLVVRGRIKTSPGKHWVVGRAYNEIVKQVFDERGIKLTVPHMTVYLGEDKSGHAPPLKIMSVDDRADRRADVDPSAPQPTFFDNAAAQHVPADPAASRKTGADDAAERKADEAPPQDTSTDPSSKDSGEEPSFKPSYRTKGV